MSRPISELAENPRGCRPGERYGIEVEAENLSQPAEGLRWTEAFHKYWTLTSDGSLRNHGVEFVSHPVTRTAVLPAIAALWPYFVEGRMRPSVRTGIHIHVSCLGLNTDHVMRMAMHYALLEPVFARYAGPEREENIYCIPWYRAHDEPTAVRAMLMNERREREPCKYSALYTGPLANFGTIEFRHAPTWTDPERMIVWWRMVQAIYHTYRTTYDVLEEYQRLGPLGLAHQVFAGVEGVPIPGEGVFDECDVLSVAEILAEVPPVVHPEWGRAPMLATPGQITLPLGGRIPLQRRGRMTIAEPIAFVDELHRIEEELEDRDGEEEEDDWEPSPEEYDPEPPPEREEREEPF